MAEKYDSTLGIPLTLTITNIPYSILTWLCRCLNPLCLPPPQIGWLSPPMKWRNCSASAERTSGGCTARGESLGPFDWAALSGGIGQLLSAGLLPALHRASRGRRCTVATTECLYLRTIVER